MTPAPVAVTLDPPASMLQPLVGAVMASLRPVLTERAEALEGVRRLRIVLSFVAGADQAADLVFVEPAREAAQGGSGLAEVAGKLAGRYGGVLMKAGVLHANHAIPERRSAVVPLKLAEPLA